MSKTLFIICILLSLHLNAEGVDPNSAKNPDQLATEAGVPQIPCKECGDQLVDSDIAPKVEKLSQNMNYILANPSLRPKGAKELIDEREPHSKDQSFKAASSTKEFRNLFNYQVGKDTTIKIKRRGFEINTKFK